MSSALDYILLLGNLDKPLWSKSPLCVNVHCLAFATPHVYWHLQPTDDV